MANNGSTGYGAEHDFAFFYDGATTTVEADNGSGPTLATINTAGWYTFQFLYSQSDGNATDISQTGLSVFNSLGTELGTTTLMNNFSGGTVNPLQNQYLAGPGYDWLTVWQNGFSGDQLKIDDISADTVTSPTPEPASFMLFGLGMAAVALVAQRKRRSATQI